jgi:DNA repair exonuclease SbcCD ATPase subunit
MSAGTEAGAELDSLPNETAAPTQETIEGAGLYTSTINRLPHHSVGSAEYCQAEDRELETFTATMQETTALLIRDTQERTKAQYMKVIERYREQVSTLRKEHNEEKRHLQEQIDLEKHRAQEGVAQVRGELEENKEELKDQVRTLQSLQQQYKGKKEQVLELRNRLRDMEEELAAARKNMIKQNKKVSKLVPLPSPPANLSREMEETQAYLDSMTRHIPDKSRVQDELKKRLRKLNKRPFTTGMLHKEPNAERQRESHD